MRDGTRGIAVESRRFENADSASGNIKTIIYPMAIIRAAGTSNILKRKSSMHHAVDLISNGVVLR